LKKGVIFFGDLSQEYRRYPGGIVVRPLKSLFKIFFGNPEQGAKLESVQGFHVLGDDHDVIGNLVGHEQLAIPVIDEPAVRVGVFDGNGRIVERILLMGFVDHLKEEESSHKNGSHTEYQKI
jgi:hypothetical protein